jgi:hypothetical protein
MLEKVVLKVAVVTRTNLGPNQHRISTLKVEESA